MLHELPSWLIVVALLVVMLAANEAGSRFGASRRDDHEEGQKTQTNATLASIIGLLALLLGFSFTMSLQRFDTRSDATIREANAIGTACLRSELINEAVKPQTQALLARYAVGRIEAGRLNSSNQDARRKANREAKQLQEDIWLLAVEAADMDPTPTRSGLFISSVNEMIDSYGARQAAYDKHLPEVVLLLLFGMLIIAEAVLGYAGGIAKSRPKVATLSFSILIVLVIFVVFDLDRPRRGFVQVNQANMLELHELVERKLVHAPAVTGS